MKKNIITKTILTNPQNKPQLTKQLNPKLNDKYFAFFEQVPVALWIEDFSKAKTYLETVASENNTDIKTYIRSNPSIVSKLALLVNIKDVNSTAVKLYGAKSKSELLGNLNDVFTEKSNIGFSKLLINTLLGNKEYEVETVNKRLGGKEFDILVKVKVIEGYEDSLENIIVSIQDISDKVKDRKIIFEREKRYKEANKIAKISSWEYDFNSNKIHWSEEAYKLVGIYRQDENLSLDFYLSFVHEDDREMVNNFSIDYLLNNPNQNLQYRVVTKQGDVKYISEKRSIIINSGRIIKILGICQDITETVLFEQKHKATKNLFSNTLSSIKDGFVILDNDSNYLFINEKAVGLLNIENSQNLIGKNIWEEFPEKEGETFFDKYQEAFKTRKPSSFENYFKPWKRWFKNRIIPSDEGMLLFFHEITDRKISENKIRKAYNIINKSSSVAILCKNEWNFPFEFVSENVLDLFGYTFQDFLSNKVKLVELAHPDDLEYIRTKFLNLNKGRQEKTIKPKPFRIITKNGNIKWVKTNIDAIRNDKGELTHIQGIAEDITEQKKTEDLFFESNQRIKDQFNNTPLASIIWDLDFKVLEWNQSAERIFGYTAQEVIGTTIEDLLTPPNLRVEMKILRETLFKKSQSLKNTNENITKSGKIITCDWYSVTLKDSLGNIIGTACMIDDITDRVNSKKIIEKSEKKYRDIFDKTIDAVLIIKEGVIVDCNKSTLKMFGYFNKQELLKTHPSKISPDIQLSGESSYIKSQRMMKIALDGGSNRFRWDHQKKDGLVFPTEVSLTRIDEVDNKPTIHAVVKDITERVKTEALEDVLYNISKAALTISDFNEFSLFLKNELNKIIETSNFYIAIYDEESNSITTPIFIDEKEKTFEVPAKKSLTGYVIRTKRPLMANKEDHLKLIALNEVELFGEYAKIWVGVPLKIREKVLGVIVVQSYDDEKAFTENDVHLLEFVADQISTTIQRKKADNELKIALTKAQESDKLKSSFLANMSHEIRTPMNGIIGFSELFLESGLSEKERIKYANIVINSGRQLLSIVNDILDISKIEAGVVQLNIESVNINNLLDSLNAFYNPKAKESGIELRCVKGLNNNDSLIEIDSVKLNQVLTNLLSNAFKFTDEGSIEFGYELINSNLQFCVKDTGVGIEKNIQDKIFDRFIQANLDLNKKLQGTGLGLAISKKLIELFNGEIWLDSDSNGSAIYFTIPYNKSKKTETRSFSKEQKITTQVENQELTILIAEDEEYNMMYINELFSKTSFRIIEANNGKIAVELAQNHPEIDLILMDIKMPIMDGHEAMNLIKKVNPSLPIIALSAFAMESDKKEALKNGFDAYLTKPIDKKLLFKIIGKYSNKVKRK